MNVYIRQLAKRLAGLGVTVDLVTEPSDLSGYEVVHTHYWRSGLLALDAEVPWVHSMHTMGLVKNATLAAGAQPESRDRIAAERAIVRAANRFVANTYVERDQLVEVYGADSARVSIVHPGVDRAVFRPIADASRDYVLFAGRLQPLKGIDVLLRAAALLGDVDVVVIGGPSGSVPYDLDGFHRRVRFLPPMPQDELAHWYANAAVVAMPSYSESFGLVAVEAQACGTPVIAARVGGLTTAVVDGVTGLLVDGHDPAQWAAALGRLLGDAQLRNAMGRKAVAHAAGFSWDATAGAMLAVYEEAIGDRRS